MFMCLSNLIRNSLVYLEQILTRIRIHGTVFEYLYWPLVQWNRNLSEELNFFYFYKIIMREENKAKTRTKGQTADFELARGLKSLLFKGLPVLARLCQKTLNNYDFETNSHVCYICAAGSFTSWFFSIVNFETIVTNNFKFPYNSTSFFHSTWDFNA